MLTPKDRDRGTGRFVVMNSCAHKILSKLEFFCLVFQIFMQDKLILSYIQVLFIDYVIC